MRGSVFQHYPVFIGWTEAAARISSYNRKTTHQSREDPSGPSGDVMGLSANSQRRGGLARVLAISFAFLTLLSLLAGLAPRAAAAVDSVDSPVKGDVWTGGATH